MKTLTFYSYKGGTGQSLLLANTALALAFKGKRVVTLDFDFEAPSLHFKFNISPFNKGMTETIPKKGVVDYLLAASQGDRAPKTLLDDVISVRLPSDVKGSLQLIPAGSAPTGEYWKTLTALLRQDFVTDPDGGGIAACLELKARIEEELQADFLLIDSRAGVTDLAWMATTILADTVICLMLANRESQSGARAVLRSLRHAIRPAGLPSIKVVPVLSRVAEHKQMLQDALAFLNDPAPAAEGRLQFDEIFLLRADAELSRGEKLHVGRAKAQSQSLHQDYLTLIAELIKS